VRNNLERYSHIYNLLLHARNVYRSWRFSEPKILRFDDGTQLELRPSYLADKIVGAQPDRWEFQLVLQELERIHFTAKKNGTHVLIVFQPAREEIYMALGDESVPDPSSPLRAALEKLSIDYLDLGPAFRRRALAGGRLFFESDGHPNRRGYKLIAYEVLAHLKNNASTYGLKGTTATIPE